jgi:transcription elongation factor GreA
MSDEHIISQEGYGKLKKELGILINVTRKEVAERIQHAKDMGDLSENAEYSEAKDAQAFNEGRIAEISGLMKNLVVVGENHSNGIVSMGSTVTVKMNGAGEKVFQIVSFNEANPIEGKISNESPIGMALLNKKKGDKIKVSTPKGQVEYEIVKIV